MQLAWLNMDADAGSYFLGLTIAMNLAASAEYHKDFMHVAVLVQGDADTGWDACLGQLAEVRDGTLGKDDVFGYAGVVTERLSGETFDVHTPHVGVNLYCRRFSGCPADFHGGCPAAALATVGYGYQ